MKCLNSKLITIFICLQLAIFPTFLFAGTVGGWTLGGGIAQGASTVYNGTKNVLINGKNVVQKGVATVTPTATGVAKVLARGAAGYALSVAVEQLLGAVDWVLDPANNQIVYNSKDQPLPTYQKIWIWNGCGSAASCLSYGYASSSPESVCRTYGNAHPSKFKFQSLINVTPTTATCTYEGVSITQHLLYVANPNYDSNAETDKKTLPLEVVAAQVISNAEGNTDKKVGAQVATTAAAADIVAEAEKDSTKARPIVNQLESSAETATDETATGEATKPNTADPTAPPDVTNISLEFPVFCGWAPTVCQAAQVVISFPNTLTDWWETSNTKADGWANSISQAWATAKDWATSEPDLKKEQTDLPMEDKTLDKSASDFDTNYLTFGGDCPAFEPYVISVGPISVPLAFDLTPLCEFALKVRPAILGMSYFTAAGIVVAAIRES